MDGLCSVVLYLLRIQLGTPWTLFNLNFKLLHFGSIFGLCYTKYDPQLNFNFKSTSYLDYHVHLDNSNTILILSNQTIC